jgi:predicted RNA binding protein YcfA (HicA-like mRNA interferase family)
VHLPAPRKGEAIADETLEKLDALLEESRNTALNQQGFAEQLQDQGWVVTQHAANGTAPHMTFKHPSGKSFSVPTHGKHAIFDESFVKANVDTIENAAVIESITVAPSAISTNEVDSPVVSGPVVKAGRLRRHPIIGITSRGGDD